ncbi:MAG: hypothetical protein ABI999_09225 [Acidobacteriota bacterium]
MRSMIEGFGERFRILDHNSRELLKKLSDELLFARPREIERALTPFSCGEYLLRSAAMVEKTFGGITTRLWDDPFEWTLPEQISSTTLLLEYLDEVEETRLAGFTLFESDDMLRREIPAPEKLRTLFDILLETVAHAEHYQGRAFAVFQVLSDDKLPRV